MTINGAKQTSITDFKSLADLKVDAVRDQKSALKEVAHQFESIFLQQMLKSMRQANSFLSDENPFNTKKVQFFRDMLDQQRSLDMAKSGGIGLADIMVRQLSPQSSVTKRGIERQPNIGVAPIPLSKPKPAEKQPEIKQHGNKLPLPDFDKLMTTASQKTVLAPTPNDFAKHLLPYAEKAAKELGVDARMLLAQAALETGWGEHILKDEKGQSSFNLFNIKENRAQGFNKVYANTDEYFHGQKHNVKAAFRKYDSFADSFNDYVSFIKNNKRYQEALAHSGDAKQYMHQLQKAGYATDPNYAEKVINIYEKRLVGEKAVQREVN